MRRRWKLIGLILLVPVIIAIGIAVWLDYARRHMPDVEAEARIRAAGGHTQRDDALPFWLPPRDTTWDELGHVWTVQHSGSVTEPMLADVAALSRLQSLTLFEARVAKEGLPHLSKLQHLRDLSLISTDLTDADLVHLHGLNSLRHTYLVNNPGLTLEGIKELQSKLPRLHIAYYARDHTVGVEPDYSSSKRP